MPKTPISRDVTSWMTGFKRVLTAAQVATDEATLEAHAGDAWMAAARPDAVAFPKSAKEVAAVLRFAHRRKIPVTARGAGRGYVGGCVPSRGGIVLSLKHLNRIVEINKADGVGIVQPQVITGHFQTAVEKQGLFYPPDPASLDECSIGGNVATNAGGPRCVKYGVTRHYVLGLQVALADGTLVRVGGRTHKNKQGFDLVGMFVGSEGLLGVVTEVTLRLLPLPPAQATLLAGFATPTACAAAVQAILGAGVLPRALETADAYTLNAARNHLGASLVPGGDACLIVALDGQPASVRAEARVVKEVIAKAGGLNPRIATRAKDREKIWDLRRGFSYSLKATGLTKLNEDVTVPRSRIVDLIALGERLKKKYRVEIASFGHAGDGNIHVNIMLDISDKATKARAYKALDELFTHVIKWDGVITGEHGIGLAKKPWWTQAAPPELRKLHRTLKHALDPNGILNPGKFV